MFRGTMSEDKEQDPLLQENSRPNIFIEYIRPCLAEFVGLWIFVFVATASVYQNAIFGVALAHGLTIGLLIIGLGHISGGHLNPAVTLGVFATGGISIIKGLLYWVSQFLGALLGAACCRAVLNFNIPSTTGAKLTAYESIKGGAHMLTGIDQGWAVFAEFLATFILVLVVLVATDAENNTVIAPLAIGFAVLVDIIAIGNVTGGSMNPARSLGPAVAISYYTGAVWPHFWVYIVGPFGGAGFAALLYRLLFGGSQKRLFLKDE